MKKLLLVLLVMAMLSGVEMRNGIKNIKVGILTKMGIEQDIRER